MTPRQIARIEALDGVAIHNHQQRSEYVKLLREQVEMCRAFKLLGEQGFRPRWTGDIGSNIATRQAVVRSLNDARRLVRYCQPKTAQCGV